MPESRDAMFHPPTLFAVANKQNTVPLMVLITFQCCDSVGQATERTYSPQQVLLQQSPKVCFYGPHLTNLLQSNSKETDHLNKKILNIVI